MSNLTINFDTLAYAKKLTGVGFTQEQAELISQTQKSALDDMVRAKDLATQADIYRFEAKIISVKADLIKWFVGTALALAALIVALFTMVK